MSAGDLLLVVGAVLCALAFAALAVTLVRVRDTLGSLRAEVAELRAETTPLLSELRASTDDANAVVAAARAERDGRLVRLGDHLRPGDEVLVDGEPVASGRVILMRRPETGE